MYIGQYKHGLYAFPSLVDELTTFVASHSTGRLLLEGPDRTTDATDRDPDASTTAKTPISVNLRLPSDMKVGWSEHSSTFSSPKPSITLFGMVVNMQFSNSNNM